MGRGNLSGQYLGKASLALKAPGQDSHSPGPLSWHQVLHKEQFCLPCSFLAQPQRTASQNSCRKASNLALPVFWVPLPCALRT